MQEMLHPLTQTANELLRAFKSETDQVNYDVGFQLEDALTCPLPPMMTMRIFALQR
jgi:hypothetical protein